MLVSCIKERRFANAFARFINQMQDSELKKSELQYLLSNATAFLMKYGWELEDSDHHNVRVLGNETPVDDSSLVSRLVNRQCPEAALSGYDELTAQVFGSEIAATIAQINFNAISASSKEPEVRVTS